jgi:PTS hybrid protein
VPLVAAGGTDEGGIGTSFDRVTAAIGAADDGDGVLVLGDLGSALLTAETAVELLDPDEAEHVRVLDAPLVEGGVAAAVAAEGGADLGGVASAAMGAGPSPAGEEPGEEPGESATATVELTNPEGLHARPAAALVREASASAARVTVNGADAKSLLSVLALGLRQGATAEIAATGPDAQGVVDRIAVLARSGFGET